MNQDHRFDRDVMFQAPDGPVAISRDARGIPFVRAAGWRGLFEGQGYATACDRMWHIEHDRRRASGTLAAITGERGHAQFDAFARRARLADLARTGLARSDAPTRAMCDAYVEGVNRRLAERPALSTPFGRIGAPRPEPMESWEPLAIFLVRHATFATWQQKLFNARVAVTCGPEALMRFSREGRTSATPVIVPPGVLDANAELYAAGVDVLDAGAPWLHELAPLGLGLSGSNAWAVHGSRTTSGAPLIAGDPHRAFESPNVYYQTGLALTDEPVDAAGFAFPGVPGIGHFGQNISTAWAVTNAMADYQDLFIERLADAVTGRRLETIEVRGANTIEIECLLTRHGPIVSDATAGIGLALASTGFDLPAGSLAAVIPQLRARTADELDTALAAWVEPVNNFVLADARGTIAYRTGGKVPIRAAVNRWLPVPGWSTDHDWSGYIPDDDLPRSRNPDVGAIVTANQRVTTAEYPHELGPRPDGPNRAERIWARLGETGPCAPDTMEKIHADAVSTLGRRVAELSAPLLREWDGRMDAGSVNAAIYATAMHALAATLAARLPEPLLTNPFRAWEPRATSATPETWIADSLEAWIADDERWLLDADETWGGLVIAAVRRAADEVAGRAWGELHHLVPLQLGGRDRVDLGSVDGGSDCVMATNDIAGASLHAITGSTCRYVWDLADRANSRWVVPMGADENESSAHHLDQRDAYVSVQSYPVFPRDDP